MTDQFSRPPRNDFRAVTDPIVSITKRVQKLEGLTADQIGNRATQVTVIQQTAESAQDAAQTAAIDALGAKADALEGIATALQAQIDAQAAQDQADYVQNSIAQPGVNKFDTAPIVAQNIAGYYTENLTGYSWITNGIRLQTPVDPGVGVRVYTLGTFAVRPGDVLSTSVTLAFDNPAVAGFGWSFFNADGAPISSSASSIGTENGLLQRQYAVPSGAASLRMNLFAFVPIGNAVTRTWVNFTNPYVGILVGSDGLAKEAVKRVNIAPGAVGTAELDPSISFTPADGSISTAKLSDLAVTDPKIAAMNASKLTGTVVLARLPATISGRTLVGGTTGQFDNLTRLDGSAWVGSVPHVEVTASSAVSNATVTNVGGFNFDTATSNDLTFITGISNGVLGFVKPGNYLITTRQNTPVYPITARSFVDIEQFISGAWVRINRTTIPTGEDFVSATASARVPSASSGSPVQVRFTVYRQVSNTSQAFQTRAIIDRLGDA